MTADTCPVCDGKMWQQEHQLRHTVTIEKCLGCCLLISKGTPRTGTGDDEFGALDLTAYFSSMETLRKNSALSLLKRIEENIQPGKILDIGCSFGWMLDVAKQRGWVTYGIEPSGVACEHIRSKGFHNLLQGIFPETTFNDVLFDAIVMTDVLEHLPDPVETLKQLRKHLQPKGTIAVRVPSRLGLIYRTAALMEKATGKADKALWRMWQFDFPYPHLWYFSPDNLCSLVKKAGYHVITVGEEPVIRVGEVKDRVSYNDNGHSGFKKLCTIAGLASCAVAGRLLKMHDECYVIARTDRNA